MTPLRGKLTAPECHPTKYVKAKLSNEPFSLQTLDDTLWEMFLALQGQKWLPLSNTLAYFNEEEKSFMQVTPGVNVIKLFFVNDDKVK
jgi:hypothetical protein